MPQDTDKRPQCGRLVRSAGRGRVRGSCSIGLHAVASVSGARDGVACDRSAMDAQLSQPSKFASHAVLLLCCELTRLNASYRAAADPRVSARKCALLPI
eukprot:2626343-Prymnesium_polylepis.1